MSINVQFAVKFDKQAKPPLHYKESLSSNVSVKYLIEKFLKDFGCESYNPDAYSLIVQVRDELPVYLKDSNIHNLGKIYLMDLCPRGEVEAAEIRTQLNSKDNDQIRRALDVLSERLVVEEFVTYCLDQSLHMEIFKLVERVSVNHEEVSLLTMKAFSELTVYTNDDQEDQNRPYISWANIKPDTIRATLEYCKTTQNFKGIEPSLKVLVSYVRKRDQLREFIFKNLDSAFIYSLLDRLHKDQSCPRSIKCSIQISLVNLINCSLQCCRESKEQFIIKLREYFEGDKMRNLKVNIEVINRQLREFPSGLPPNGGNEPTKEEHCLIQELTKLQYYILYPVFWDYNDKEYDGPKMQDLDLFKQLVSGSDGESETELYKKLGFQNTGCPAKDFVEPPGHLVFNCVRYLVYQFYDEIAPLCNKIKGFSNFQIIKIAFSLVKILNKAFRLIDVIEDENMEDGIFMPLIFHACEFGNELSKSFFCNFFYKCFMVYTQSLIDLKFKNEDLDELEDYFAGQISEVLNCYPMTLSDFSSWLGKVKTENTRKEKLRTVMMEWEGNQQNQNPVINQLRNELELEYKNIVSKKRIKQLQERPYSFELRAQKNVQMYSLRLDDSQSVIIAQEDSDPNSRLNKWPISNIKKVSTEVSAASKKNAFYFSLHIDVREELKDDSAQLKIFSFTCNNKRHYSIWLDGLNVLMNKPPISQEFKEEVLNLVRLEMKIRFLMLNKEDIPHEAPQLPSLPDNYDFSE